MKHLTGLWIVLGMAVFFAGFSLPSMIKANANARAIAACVASGGEWTRIEPYYWLEGAQMGCLRDD